MSPQPPFSDQGSTLAKYILFYFWSYSITKCPSDVQPLWDMFQVALLFASPRSRTITALTNCDLNVLSKKDLDDILNKFPKFRHEMTAIAQVDIFLLYQIQSFFCYTLDCPS